MKAFVKGDTVVGIYPDDYPMPEDCVPVVLDGRKDMPQIGWNFDGETFTRPEPVVVSPTLDALKTSAITVLDVEASAVRFRFIGDMNNQFGIYTAKYHDAKAWKLKIYGEDLSEYKWIEAEVSAVGGTADEAAARFITLYSTMVSTLAKVEEMRIHTKAAIRNASNIEEIRKLKSEALAYFKTL